MCGIFGVVRYDVLSKKDLIISCRDLMKHRGPDGEGLYINEEGTVALAHRRLSIIDLSEAANQPMSTDDGRFTLVYNGEIYNYLDLRENLVNDGIKLKTNSDTEVLLKLFEQKGLNCLNELRGMFAFVIWDNFSKKLYGARDRFGIKPLYFTKKDKEFVFSSELKAIKHYYNNLQMSEVALDAFLRMGSIPSPLTLYENVYSLLPGHYLELNISNQNFDVYLNVDKYFSFLDLVSTENDNSKIFNSNKKEVIKTVREALLDSVQAHLVADVEVGAFLSGGIDSTALVSLMRQVGKEKIRTVSIVFPGTKFDESKYARLAAKKYQTEHVEIPVSEKDVLDELENIFYYMDQPTIDGVNTYFVSKAAKEAGLKVVLSGLGGDELFGGYPSFNLIPKLRKLKKLPFSKFLMSSASYLLKDKLPSKANYYLNNPYEKNAEYKLVRGLFTEVELNKIGWSCEGNGRYNKKHIEEEILDFYSDKTKKTFLNNYFSINENLILDLEKSLNYFQYVSYLETTYYMANQLLRDSDVFSMANSIELRVPYVDNKLYGTILSFNNVIYNKHFPKENLVQAVGDIPFEIFNRTKLGFTFPFEDWIRTGQLKQNIYQSLKNLDNKFVLNDNQFEKDNYHWSRIWALYVLNQYINKE